MHLLLAYPKSVKDNPTVREREIEPYYTLGLTK